ncbi:hypothetical protein Scep_008124 [Stephania cephalantha]|uniref:Oxidative stress 3 n=1 Tax=Stephania cephalantha TaxID=152367 RepID=A0AAP0KBE0_9MAGN
MGEEGITKQRLVRDPWVALNDEDDDCMSDSSMCSTDSLDASSTSSSSELVEDASSSTTWPSPKGPLYELSELMAHLPIKRGLSKHFQGKSQSFTSLCNVRSLEDLAKKECPLRKKMKSCKSYGGGLDGKRTISKKKVSKGRFFCTQFNR